MEVDLSGHCRKRALAGLLIITSLYLIATAVLAEDQVVPFDPANIVIHYHGQTSDAALGWEINGLGDINGDGFDDIAVSSGTPLGTYICFGGSPPDTIADMWLTNHTGLADPIDLDGDGINDVVARGIYNLGDPFDRFGVMYFYRGYGDSLASVPYDSIRPETDNYGFARLVRTAYVDDDDLGDLLTYRYQAPGGPRFYYYSGAPTLDTIADWTYSVTEWSHTCSNLGFIDFNGDSHQDIFIGLLADLASLSYVYIFLGPTFGDEPDIIIGHPEDVDPDDGNVVTFAEDLDNVGDITGDGYDDLAVVYYNHILIYKGGPTFDTLYDYHFAGSDLGGAGNSVSAAGDINKDGYNDFLAGDGRVYGGVVDLYLGGPVFNDEIDLSIYEWNLPPSCLEQIGYNLSPAGDFNGDGYGDFMFSARNMWLCNMGGDFFLIEGGPYLPTDVQTPTDIPLPSKFNLRQNYPNPFNPDTEIEFALPHACHAKLEIYNIVGQRIAVLVDRHMEAGYHTVCFDGGKMASGIYLYRLQAGDFVESKKMLLVK